MISPKKSNIWQKKMAHPSVYLEVLFYLPLSLGTDASSSAAPRCSSRLVWPEGWGDARGMEGELARFPGSRRRRG